MGHISDSVDLLSGGHALYVAVGTVAAGTTDPLTNTADIAPPGGLNDPDMSNNSSTIVTVSIDVIFQDGFESGDTGAWSSAVGGAAPQEP